MVLLITGTIASQSTYMTYLTDVSERLKQYIECIEFYLCETSINKIVFCENSNYKFDSRALYELAKKNNKLFELLQFDGDYSQIVDRGKGYGEGEIIEYALENSKLFLQSKYFIKVTGRLIISNIDILCKRIDFDRVYFNCNLYYYPSIDTKMYGMPIALYKDTFRKAYYDVNDKENQYIESIFYNIIKNKQIKVFNFHKCPVFEGISGSCGFNYFDDIVHIRWLINIGCYLNVVNKRWFYFFIYKLLQVDRKLCRRRLFY